MSGSSISLRCYVLSLQFIYIWLKIFICWGYWCCLEFSLFNKLCACTFSKQHKILWTWLANLMQYVWYLCFRKNQILSFKRLRKLNNFNNLKTKFRNNSNSFGKINQARAADYLLNIAIKKDLWKIKNQNYQTNLLEALIILWLLQRKETRSHLLTVIQIPKFDYNI